MKQIVLSLFIIPLLIFGQEKPPSDTDENLFDELDELTTKGSSEVIATFKSTRIILGQSTERAKENQLHFRISHVFSKINGIDNFFGLDNLNNMHISFEYGINNNLQVGLARSNKPDQTYSGTVKGSLLRQKTGENPFPLSLSYYGGIDYKSRDYIPEARDKNFVGRLDYINQVLISRKFSDKLSLQISPTWVHRNLTDAEAQPNDIFSLGLGGRYMFSRSSSVNLEYYHTIPTFDASKFKGNALSVGFDIETGGHVFQLYFTNAFALHPGKFAVNQNGDFFGREISIGFSILREFSL